MAFDCPFCSPDTGRVFFDSPLVVGLWDAFAVNPGHALLVPRRHVATWFDAALEEQMALLGAIEAARRAIEARHRPDGYNLGVNIGSAGGQTVPHLHLHVIPRYSGDVPDPRGGVRHVIPARGNYLAGAALTGSSSPQFEGAIGSALPGGLVAPPRLIRGEDDPLAVHLTMELDTADAADLAVAFVLPSGVDRLESHFRDLLARGGRLRVVTGDYFGLTDPVALSRLLDLGDGVDLRVFETGAVGAVERVSATATFHPKAYLFHRRLGRSVAFVGSSNLSHSALGSGVEWNFRVVAESASGTDGFASIAEAFERLLAHPRTRRVTPDWIAEYAERRPSAGLAPVVQPGEVAEPVEPAAAGESYEAATPHGVQLEALAALERTRSEGHQAGLVVLATGLGKTWLSAFDTDRPEYRRVLFVAHREEILDQALKTFRRVRPLGRLGRFTGGGKEPEADVLFASVQTLSRVEHLRRFARERFDYIVIDEFHHASARTYRKILDYFTPKFLLGLTATPERTDGGDLLALCGENLVYRCDLGEGIERDLLCPFHYFGVPDEVDYTNIPWRSSRFDEEELTRHVATRSRAENALEQLRKRGGERAIAFCVSQRHADFMAEFFRENGLRAVAVHAGPSSAPRATSLERLEAGELQVVCAVDMFNEGVDVPLIDTVMMLRPTESRLLWLQQLGRGLRKAAAKARLVVIDYIGNHRTFLLKPQALFGLPPGDVRFREWLAAYERGGIEMPPGCEVTYDLAAIDILRSLLRDERGPLDALGRYVDEFTLLHGMRPSAAEAHHDGYRPGSARKSYGSWLEFVAQRKELPEAQSAALERHVEFLRDLETTPMTKSFKMLVLLAMLERDELPGSLSLPELSTEVGRLASRHPLLTKDFGGALEDSAGLAKLLETNPVAAWVGGKGTGGTAWFSFDGNRLATTFAITDRSEREAFQELARELAEWRLAEYLDRPVVAGADEAGIVCKVSHSGGSPILFLPDRATRPEIPEGWTPVTIDGAAHEANFVKVAVNVVRRVGEEGNVLPAVLRGWFGPDAGAPGTNRSVRFVRSEEGWTLEPLGRREGVLQVWRRYSREEIPKLFGFEFNTGAWNQGYVTKPGHLFLLVTLDKSGHGQEFQYRDRFLEPDLFQWESQNRTRRESKDGRRIQQHEKNGERVHLFVRGGKKTNGGGASPFVYCGDVRFVDWEGDAPITVRWRLPEAVPGSMLEEWGR